MSTVTVKLPPRFFWDHVERGCGANGVIINQGKTWVLVELDLEAYNDLRSDALYYSDSSQFSAEYRGLSASARATYKALVKVGPPIDVDHPVFAALSPEARETIALTDRRQT